MISATHMHPFYTIGHSTRSIVEFMDLLRSVQVTLVADVRTVPRSPTNPNITARACRTRLGSSESTMSTSRHWAVFVAPHATSCPGSMLFGRTRAFITTPITPWGAGFTKVWLILLSWVERSAAPLCAPKQCGGGAIDELSGIIWWPPARLSFT
jgi:hypothetical protein